MPTDLANKFESSTFAMLGLSKLRFTPFTLWRRSERPHE